MEDWSAGSSISIVTISSMILLVSIVTIVSFLFLLLHYYSCYAKPYRLPRPKASRGSTTSLRESLFPNLGWRDQDEANLPKPYTLNPKP